MNTRTAHTPSHPLPFIERPTFAPEASLPVVGPSGIPTAILPRPDPVDAGVAALREVNAAIDRAERVIASLSPDQCLAVVQQVTPHPKLMSAEAGAIAEGRADALQIARRHLARFAPSSYAHPALAALVAELEATLIEARP